MPIRIDINLLPPEFRPAPPVRWTPPYLALLYSLGLFLILWFIFYSYEQVSAKRAEIDSLETLITSLKPIEEAYDASRDAVSSLEDVKTLFAYLDTHYVDWPIFLSHLQPQVPSQIWLASATTEVVKTGQKTGEGGKKETVILEHEGKITVEGYVNGYPVLPIATFLNNLRQDPYFVDPRLDRTLLKEEEASVSRNFFITMRLSKLGVSAEDQDGQKPQGASKS